MKEKQSTNVPARRAAIWQVSVRISRESEDAILELLSAVFREAPASHFDWETGTCVAMIYLERKPDKNLLGALGTGLRHIRECGLDCGSGRVSVNRLPYRSWAESWKRHFKPINLRGKVLLKPSWSRLRPRPGQRVVVLDPGLSFGTGQHPTTRFCLEQLVDAAVENQPQSLLDLGTGSGILAITAAKLGFKPIHAIDIDPEAVRMAKANAARNQVSKKLSIRRADLRQLEHSPRRTYSVICANLMADLLIASRRTILARLKKGGRLIVAGILSKEFELVRMAFVAKGLKLKASRLEKEWRSGTFISGGLT